MYEKLLARVNHNYRLTKGEILFIISSANSLFKPQKFVNRLNLPKLTVCGDIHGQFFDMKNIFQKNGCPSRDNPYLFNGDVVDRGPNSVQCISTLLLYKLMDPMSMYINRGNHELREMNAKYGFKAELNNDNELFSKFNDLFDLLPFCHVVNDSFFVVHGGVPRQGTDVSLEDLEKGSVAPRVWVDLLWNDPCDENGIHPSPRGYGPCRFGPDITLSFLNKNKLRHLIRSHEMVRNGIQISQNGLCTTVFSASNYMREFGNKGGYLVISGHDEIAHFSYSTHISKL